MSDDLRRLADRMRAALDSESPDRALMALGAEPDLLRLPRIDDRPHPLVGLAVALIAVALNRSGMTKDVPGFLDSVADELIPKDRYYSREIHRFRLMVLFPYLWYPAIVASIAMQDYEDAVAAILNAADEMRFRERWDMPDDAVVSPLLGHPAIAAYCPFGIDRGWLLERQEEVLRSAALDRVRRKIYRFEELFLPNALRTGPPERAMPVIERRGLSGGSPLAAVGDSACDDLEFYAVCVLATLGRFDEALALARALVTSGYYRWWRFNLDAAKDADWTQWLGPLSETLA